MSYPPPSVTSDSSPAADGVGRIKPGRGWYWVGGILLVGGLLGAAALGVAGLLNMKNSIEDFGRFKVVDGRGAATVTFEKPGTYSIYYESKSKVCADLAAASDDCEKVPVRGESDPPARLDISITDGDVSLPIEPADNSFDYTISGFSGTEVATVDVDQAGSYNMVVETRREGEFAIALGKDVLSTILPWILGALALAIIGLVLGLIILIVTAVKRSRRKRAAAMAAATTYPTPSVYVAPATPAAPPVAAPPVAAPPPAAPPPAAPQPAVAPVLVPPAPPPAAGPPPGARLDAPSAPPAGESTAADHTAFAPPPGAAGWGAPAGAAAPAPTGPSSPPPPPPAPEPSAGERSAPAAEDDDAAPPLPPPPPPPGASGPSSGEAAAETPGSPSAGSGSGELPPPPPPQT